MRRPVFRVTNWSGLEDELANLAPGAFAFGTISQDSPRTVLQEAERLGFMPIQTKVSLRLRLPSPCSSGRARNFMVRHANNDDQVRLREIAKISFTDDRFHQDSRIGRPLAAEIKQEWVSSFFEGSRGKWLLVAEDTRGIAGFLLLCLGKSGNLICDLIAVDPERKRAGAASSLLCFAAQEWGEDFSFFDVSTQQKNVAAVGLYSSLGFRPTASEFVFHFHKGITK